jgi:error-prone DNA polymerase
VQEYLARRSRKKPVTYDHPLEERALARTLGVILFQDQVNQLAIDVAGFGPGQADQLRRAFGRRHNEALIQDFHRRFLEGAAAKGVGGEAAERIFRKFNGLYMFPESHAFAFGVTAYQASWLKLRYPLEFFVGIFNQQPMGFYNLETLKEDAKRHGIRVFNPDVNKSAAGCLMENGAVRLGFLNVLGLGEAAAKAMMGARESGSFRDIGDFLSRTGVLEEVALGLAGAGAFDSLEPNRRRAKWEIGLRYRPAGSQLALTLPVAQDMVELAAPTPWERMKEEYDILSLYPGGHVMEKLRPHFRKGFYSSREILRLRSGASVSAAGLVIRRQRPQGRMVFITLEDEFGHIPLMVFPQVYERYEHVFKSPFLVVKGRFLRREGTHNVVVTEARPFQALEKAPASKDWR